MKMLRQTAILDIVETEAITSQEQLRDRLKTRGIDATQATLSRDIHDLGLIKRPADGAYHRPPAAPEVPGVEPAVVLRRAVEEYLRREDAVDHLLVLKTDTGQAQPLAVAVDRARLAEIVGTIAGDDTILVICRTPADASALAVRLGELRARAATAAR